MSFVMVFTSKPLETIFEEGGSGDWSANKKRLEKCSYLITVKSETYGEYFPTDNTIQLGSAFLVGKISNITTSPTNDRWVIQFSEYAEINIPHAWTGNRNPVAYGDIVEFESKYSLDISSLEWKEFPASKVQVKTEIKPLTIDEAKKGIAQTLGIDSSCIEIQIKA